MGQHLISTTRQVLGTRLWRTTWSNIWRTPIILSDCISEWNRERMFYWKIAARKIRADAVGIFNCSPKSIYPFKGGFEWCNSLHEQIQKTSGRVRCLKEPSTQNSRYDRCRGYFHSSLRYDIGFVVRLGCGVSLHHKVRCRAINSNSKRSLRPTFALINLLTQIIVQFILSCFPLRLRLSLTGFKPKISFLTFFDCRVT